MAGIDSFTKLMLHCNGIDASTSFPDASASAHTVTAKDNAQVDTAQSKFGGASALFDNTNDYLEIPNSTDWDWTTVDMTWEGWMRPADLSNNMLMGRVTSGTSYFYFGFEGTTLRFRDYNAGNIINIQVATSISTGNWYHVACTRSGNDFRLFVNGVQQGTTVTAPISFLTRTDPLDIGTLRNAVSYFMNGHIDEVRISKGIARWTSNFTPPTSEYTSPAETIDINETITLSDSIGVTTNPEQISINETITLSDNIEVLTNPEIIGINETISLSDAIEVGTDPEIIGINETITLSDVNNAQRVIPADYASQIIHYNPLYYVTNNDPAVIVEIDITTPGSPVHTIYELVGVAYATDLAINTITQQIYVACANGKVVVVDQTNLNNQTIVDLSDLDDLQTIETMSEMGLTYTGTENSVGELYLLDDRSTLQIEGDFHLLSPKQVQIDTDFNLLNTFNMVSDFTLLSEKQFTMDTDFKLISAPVNQVNPIVLDDFHVFINGIELEDTDLQLNTIKVQKSEGQKDVASFILTRRHDNLNETLIGTSSVITNQNAVIVKIKSTTIFTGKVGGINPDYSTEIDNVKVTAYGEIPIGQYNNVLLSLPGENEVLNLYHILLQNYEINNEYIDPNEENPTRFKGIRVSLGNEIRQQQLRFTDWDYLGTIAEDIQEGTYNFANNFTYFWGASVKKFGEVDIKVEANTPIEEDVSNLQNTPFEKLKTPVFKLPEMEFPENFTTFTGREQLFLTDSIHFSYIGTSLSPVSSDLWQLTQAPHRRQKILPDLITKLGDGNITTADLQYVVDNPTTVLADMKNKNWLKPNGDISIHFKQSIDVNTPSKLIDLSITSCEQAEIYEILENKLGYTIGSAPYNDISTKNGKLITSYRWKDLKGSGLYSVREAGYDYTEYAKKVAELEYKKLSNINGDILPDTSCNIDLTVDALLYFNLNILSRVNIDNTIKAGIYKNNNGFPISVKSILIDTASMKVKIQGDNAKSKTELEAIDGEFPCDENQEYLTRESIFYLATKSDMKTRLAVDEQILEEIRTGNVPLDREKFWWES